MTRAAPERRSARQGQPAWALTPLEGVGPLHFGMHPDVAAEALPEARVLNRFRANPVPPEVLGIQFGFRPNEPKTR